MPSNTTEKEDKVNKEPLIVYEWDNVVIGRALSP